MALIELDINSMESFIGSIKSYFPLTTARRELTKNGYSVKRQGYWFTPDFDHHEWISSWSVHRDGHYVGFLYKDSFPGKLNFVSFPSGNERNGLYNDPEFESLAKKMQHKPTTGLFNYSKRSPGFCGDAVFAFLS